jgi:hypothetical protein
MNEQNIIYSSIRVKILNLDAVGHQHVLDVSSTVGPAEKRTEENQTL